MRRERRRSARLPTSVGTRHEPARWHTRGGGSGGKSRRGCGHLSFYPPTLLLPTHERVAGAWGVLGYLTSPTERGSQLFAAARGAVRHPQYLHTMPAAGAASVPGGIASLQRSYASLGHMKSHPPARSTPLDPFVEVARPVWTSMMDTIHGNSTRFTRESLQWAVAGGTRIAGHRRMPTAAVGDGNNAARKVKAFGLRQVAYRTVVGGG